MKKKFSVKAIALGFAAMAAGAVVSAPALLPTQAFAATEAVETADAVSANTVNDTESKTVVWTIRALYKNDDGSTRPVKSTDGSDYKVTRSATFTRTVVKDAKTGKVISAGNWADSVKLADVDAPVIQGYTADKSRIAGITVSHDSKPADTIIYYTQKPENKKTAITESKEVTRKITYYRVNDDGTSTQTYGKTQRVTFSRTGTVDGNGKKEFAAWTPYTWAAEDVAPMSGYKASITTIPAVTFTPDNPPSNVDVYFRKNKGASTNGDGSQDYVKGAFEVIFTDGQGKVLSVQNIEDNEAATAPKVPTRSGYTFAGWDKSFDKITGPITVNATWKANNTETVTEERKVTRTIYYLYDDGKPVISTEGTPCKQVNDWTFRRVGTKDTVTGKITDWSDWSNNFSAPAVTPVAVQGYTPDIKSIPATTVTPDTKSWEVKVYYTKNGSASKFTGFKSSAGKWVRYKNGAVDKSFTGLYKASDGVWYYFKAGTQDNYTGLVQAASGKWYYVRNGKYDTSYTGMAQAKSGKWYYVKNGNYCISFTGLAPAPGGKWMYVSKGVYKPSFTGLAQAASGKWYYVKNGNYDKTYTGLARAASGKWYYVKKGNYDASFSGKVPYNGKSYTVKKGRVV